MKFLAIFLILCSHKAIARSYGQTEITTDEGIEVFQQEKYYLLKKNVNIISDDFELNADIVKAYFDKDLYDVVKVDSQGSVILKSSQGVEASGEHINFNIVSENLIVNGKNSLLITNEIIMNSDKLIKVNNTTGAFKIEGLNSNLKNNDVNIAGFLIEGVFVKIDNNNEIESLYVEDNTQINIKTKTLDMYALKANYNKKNNIIELFNNVKIIRDNELITGDYANINTLDESYKVTSKNSEKVKILLNKTNE